MTELLLITQLLIAPVNIPFKFWSAQTENREDKPPKRGSGRRNNQFGDYSEFS